MVTVYLEKHGKVLVGKLNDNKADAVLDYVCIEGDGEVSRRESKEVFVKTSSEYPKKEDATNHCNKPKVCKKCGGVRPRNHTYCIECADTLRRKRACYIYKQRYYEQNKAG